MFIWLASYPKSGNTLLRSLLASYFFSNDGIFNFDIIKNIKQFPNIKLFENLGIDIKNEKEVIKNYIKVQESINKKNSIQFLKTHSYLFNINNNGFTDLNNTLGAIYVVRDPRNVVTSFAHHSGISVDEAADQLVNLWQYGGDLNSNQVNHRTKVYLGTWGSNFNSWKSFKSPEKYLLIKYEDLVADKESTLLKILKFIHKLKKIEFKADKATYCEIVGGATNKFGARFFIEEYKSLGQISQPTLQPVKRKYLEKLFIIIAFLLYLRNVVIFFW